MNAPIGEVLETARLAKGMTQAELAEAAGLKQATLSRYEHGLRTPTEEQLETLAAALGVTVPLLRRGDRMDGGIAVVAHMRRRATAKVGVWRQLEARLNMLRLHASQLSSEVRFQSDLQIPTFDPIDYEPAVAATMVRTQWRMPVGPVRSLAVWMEAAGALVFEDEFGPAARVDGLSQWSSDHAVILLNASAPHDRKRLTLAHELGHLVLHGTYTSEDVEQEANAFAAELLMPEEQIRPMLRGRLTLSTLLDLKRYWGVSIQALIMRAAGLGEISEQQRTSLFKQLSARRWRIQEPGSDEVHAEIPRLPAHIAESLRARGLSPREVANVLGYRSETDNTAFPLGGDRRHLSSV